MGQVADPKARRCRRKFQSFYPKGFADADYLELERDYKRRAHQRWNETLSKDGFKDLLLRERFAEIAETAVKIESRTNLLFSFEKIALRDAVRGPVGARMFSEGLFDFLYGRGKLHERFARWAKALQSLPRRGTRVATWPVATVFPFLARPDEHVFLKPNTTKRAAEAYGFEFEYSSKLEPATYASLLAFAQRLERDLADWKPRDMIDIQGFIWVLGSDEYA